MSQLLKPSVDWSELISADEWAHYKEVVDCAKRKGIDFALGGGLAYSNYAPRTRNTKDIDLFIEEKDRASMIDCLSQAVYEDYYDREPYDRTWIYRGFKAGTIVDVIWTMPNHRMLVDRAWLTRGQEVVIHGDRIRLLPPEELLYSKIYVMQHDRCDWPDLMNILYSEGATLDWDHLIGRLGADIGLLRGLMSVYGWLCPAKSGEVPKAVWAKLHLPEPCATDCHEADRAFLLDTRDWFGPHRENGERC